MTNDKATAVGVMVEAMLFVGEEARKVFPQAWRYIQLDMLDAVADLLRPSPEVRKAVKEAKS